MTNKQRAFKYFRANYESCAQVAQHRGQDHISMLIQDTSADLKISVEDVADYLAEWLAIN